MASRYGTPMLVAALGAFAFHPGRQFYLGTDPGYPPFPEPDPDPAPDPEPVPMPGPDPGFPDSPGFPQPLTV